MAYGIRLASNHLCADSRTISRFSPTRQSIRSYKYVFDTYSTRYLTQKMRSMYLYFSFYNRGRYRNTHTRAHVNSICMYFVYNIISDYYDFRF